MLRIFCLAWLIPTLALAQEGGQPCYKTGDVYTAENMNLPPCETQSQSNVDAFRSGDPNTQNTGASPWNNQGGGSFSSSGVGGGGSNQGAPRANRAPAAASPQGGGAPAPSSSGSSYSPAPSPSPYSGGGTGGSDYNQTYQNNGDAHWIK